MNNRCKWLFFAFIILSACATDENDISPNAEYSEYEIKVIDYFKDIALGFEFGDTSKITRKWDTEMRIFIGGDPSHDLVKDLESIKNEINNLASDGFRINIVDDSLVSNYYIFFGAGNRYVKMFPAEAHFVDSNLGLFSVYSNDQNKLTSGHMYIDIMRTNSIEQKHLLREELTQSIGLARDSPKYMESIFQSAWTTTVDYAPIDKELIKFLYHPRMDVGLNQNQVDKILKEILISE